MDSNLLHVIAAEAAALVQNAILAESEKAARQARAELQIAAGIQRGLMAVRLPQLHYAEVNANSIPCREIGGDFFDVLVIDGVLNVVVTRQVAAAREGCVGGAAARDAAGAGACKAAGRGAAGPDCRLGE